MKLNSRAGVSILELAIYAPALIIAFIVCKRHGFGRSSGWIYTLILCLIRIVGACCQLVTYSDHSSGLLETTIILDSIGISPLLFATLGLLSRCVDSINSSHKTFFGAIHFRLVQLLIMIGLIMSIVGGTSSISSTGVYKVQTTSEVGIGLYCAAYAALVLITLSTISKVSHIQSTDNRLVWAVIIALPLILVRLIYSLLVVFHHSHDFNLISGSVIILACMSVIEEVLVVLLYLLVGWMTEAPRKDAHGAITNRPWKGALDAGNRQGNSTAATERVPVIADYQPGGIHQTYPAANAQQEYQSASAGPQYPTASAGRHNARGNGRGFRQGPIHGLIGLAVAAAQNNKGDVERG